MQPNMQKYQLTKEEMYGLLDRSKVAILSTVGEDGYPYGTPINFVRIGDSIYFHGRRVGEKVSNLQRDPRCCLTVMEENGFEHCGEGACNTTTNFESVIIRGKVAVVEDIECKKKVLRATVDKLTPERRMDAIDDRRIPSTGIFRLDIESMTGKYRRPEPGHRIMR